MPQQPGAKKEVTIYDIAKALDVSPSTVSRSLKRHPSISKETIRRVQKHAKKVGYRSNIFAQNLRRQKTNIIGVIVPRLNSHFMSAAISGMEKVANQNGYNIIISQSLETAAKEAANVETMLNQRVDGLIVSLAYDTEQISHFENIGVPLIFFDRISNFTASSNVVINNFEAAYNTVSHLIVEGCGQIVHITGNLTRNVYADRLEGYKQALADHNISYSSDLLIINNLNEEDGYDAARKILNMNPRPDGIFVSNDLCAVSCMVQLKEEGIRIPRDIAVAGFNNDPVSRFVEPGLTTVHYNGNEIGEVVARRLIKQIGENSSETGTITLSSKLIIRESSRKSDFS